MNQGNILKEYALSPYTMERLKAIRETLRDDIVQSDPFWKIIAGKKERMLYLDAYEISDESTESCNDVSFQTPEQFSSTQFYFTQLDKQFDKNCKQMYEPKLDIVECLYEGLECPNGKLDINQLEPLMDVEVVEIVCELEKKLTVLGTYNLCRAMNNMTLEQRIKYATVFHSYLLLPKIIALEEPSRLLVSVVTECVQKFPDDIQKLIFVPLLNVDLKDVTIVEAIVNAFESQRRTALIMEYLSNVKELKSWHLTFLHNLISVKTDSTLNGKVVQLLYEKALDLAKDKNFGKLVLSFIKVNSRFSEEQKRLLWEIANTNETLFKKPIQNVLRTI